MPPPIPVKSPEETFRDAAGINSPFGPHPTGASDSGSGSGGATTAGGSPPATGPKPGDTREITLPSGRIVLQTYSPTGDMNLDGSLTYEWANESSYFGKDGPGGSAESAAQAAANRRLQAMTASLGSFLQAQSLADARKMAASEQFQKMAQFAVPKGTTVMPGWEEGGPMQALSAVRGRPQFQARGVETQHVNPAQLAEAGQVPPEVMQMINAVRGAG